MSHRLFIRRNNDYVTTFHIAGRPPVKDSQPWAPDMDNGLCGLLNACHQVTITYRHNDATDSPMFIVQFSSDVADVRCANRPKGPYTLTSFLVPVAGAGQLAPVNWRVCHATGTRISLVPVTGTSRF